MCICTKSLNIVRFEHVQFVSHPYAFHFLKPLRYLIVSIALHIWFFFICHSFCAVLLTCQWLYFFLLLLLSLLLLAICQSLLASKVAALFAYLIYSYLNAKEKRCTKYYKKEERERNKNKQASERVCEKKKKEKKKTPTTNRI